EVVICAVLELLIPATRVNQCLPANQERRGVWKPPLEGRSPRIGIVHGFLALALNLLPSTECRYLAGTVNCLGSAAALHLLFDAIRPQFVVGIHVKEPLSTTHRGESVARYVLTAIRRGALDANVRSEGLQHLPTP